MLLSIVVPVFNVQEYLHRCVSSLLKEYDQLDYEIILIDDGSTDRSGLICDEYNDKYEYIKVFHKPNGGLSDARNFGLTKSCGKYVVFIDSDDYVERGSIVKLCEYIQAQDCDIYCCDYYSLRGEQKSEIKYTPLEDVKTGIDFMKYQLARRSMVSSVVQNIYKRTFLMENNLFFKKGIFHEDEEWYPRVFYSADSVKYLNYSYYVYIIRDNSIMQQKDFSKHIIDFVSTMTGLLNMFENKDDVTFFNLLKDSLVDKYLSIYARGNFGYGYKDILISRKILGKGLVHRKTKIKAAVFLASRRLFCKISRLYNERD